MAKHITSYALHSQTAVKRKVRREFLLINLVERATQHNISHVFISLPNAISTHPHTHTSLRIAAVRFFSSYKWKHKIAVINERGIYVQSI
jgi:hypothetical protein